MTTIIMIPRFTTTETMMLIKILPVNGHYEVYVDGNFYCSADTKAEAEHEIGLILS